MLFTRSDKVQICQKVNQLVTKNKLKTVSSDELVYLVEKSLTVLGLKAKAKAKVTLTYCNKLFNSINEPNPWKAHQHTCRQHLWVAGCFKG
jgi:hypothetical protein